MQLECGPRLIRNVVGFYIMECSPGEGKARCHDSNQIGDERSPGDRAREDSLLRLSGCSAECFHLAEPNKLDAMSQSPLPPTQVAVKDVGVRVGVNDVTENSCGTFQKPPSNANAPPLRTKSSRVLKPPFGTVAIAVRTEPVSFLRGSASNNLRSNRYTPFAGEPPSVSFPC